MVPVSILRTTQPWVQVSVLKDQNAVGVSPVAVVIRVPIAADHEIGRPHNKQTGHQQAERQLIFARRDLFLRVKAGTSAINATMAVTAACNGPRGAASNPFLRSMALSRSR